MRYALSRSLRRAWASRWMIVLGGLLAFSITGCGTTSLPSCYLWTDVAHLETLTWHEQDGKLSGQYSGISYAQANFPGDPRPDTYEGAYSGKIDGQAVRITVVSGMLSFTMTGTAAPDHGQLSLSFLDPASGKRVERTWVRVSMRTASALTQAFHAYQTARGWLTVVEQQANDDAGWTDPNAGALSRVQTALEQQQMALSAIQAAGGSARCQLIARYIPLAPSVFLLPFNTGSSALSSALARYLAAWRQAERSAVPHVSGITLPWLLSQKDEQRAIAPAFALAARMRAASREDARRMQQDQRQSQQMDQQVTEASRGCPPMPA